MYYEQSVYALCVLCKPNITCCHISALVISQLICLSNCTQLISCIQFYREPFEKVSLEVTLFVQTAYRRVYCVIVQRRVYLNLAKAELSSLMAWLVTAWPTAWLICWRMCGGSWPTAPAAAPTAPAPPGLLVV